MKKNNDIFIIIFCMVIAIITLFCNSHCSPLYSFNAWDDFNAFYTVGSSWAKGLIPYRDLFEQKGPFLYLIYFIGYCITPNKFIGIFILEILFLTINLYICSKIIKLFINDKIIFIILIVYATFLTTSSSFVTGGSAEEFNLLFSTLTIYYILKYLKTSKLSNMNYKELFIIGLACGLSLMIKYTTIGLWFSLMSIICFNLIKNKQYKQAILKGLIFITSALIPLAIFILYFYFKHSLYDFINTYFYINIFKYSIIKFPIIINFLFPILFVLVDLFKLDYLILIILSGLQLFNSKKVILMKIKKESYIQFFIITMFTIISVYFGQGQYYKPYSRLVIYYYVLLFLIYLFSKTSIKKFVFIYILLIPILLLTNLDYNKIMLKKEQIVQYRFANIINKYDEPTILQYRSLDEGFYTAAKILPINKYFEQQNLTYEAYSENYDTQDELIKNKKVDFVIMRKQDFVNLGIKNPTTYLYQNYDLIDIYQNNNGYYDNAIYYLYKVRK